MIATERLYLNFDRTKVLKHGDPEARWLLVAVGQVLPDATALKYGLLGERRTAERKERAPAEDKSDNPSETKAASSPKAKAKKGK